MSTEPEKDEINIETELSDDYADADTLELEDEEALSANVVKKWRTKYKEAEAKAAAALEETQRVKADFLNSKRRLEEETARAKERAVEQLIESLLPLCDSFAMAMVDTAAWEAIEPNWRKGMEGIYAQLQQILVSHHVQIIDPVGESFDPARHEALSTEDSEGDSDTVTTVIQLGFERNGTVIRPAKVIISN